MQCLEYDIIKYKNVNDVLNFQDVGVYVAPIKVRYVGEVK